MPTGPPSAIHLPLSHLIVEQRGWRVKGSIMKRAALLEVASKQTVSHESCNRGRRL